jgi:uncharacterized iron-regulated membrane protein
MRALRTVHRYCSLVFAVLWLLQAATGVLLVFHWELDDALVAGPAAKLDAARLGARLQAVQAARPHDRVASLYASGGDPGRFDILVETQAGGTDAIRIDGAGTVLRDAPYDYDWPRAGLFQFATYLHQTLLLGDRGTIFIGVSGVLLLSNLLLGMRLAWPRRGQWLRALRPARLRGIAWFYAWHRALGLAFVVPALLLVATGILLAFAEPVSNWIGVVRATPGAVEKAGEIALPPGAAIAAALQRFPDGQFASLRMPGEDSPWYRVRLRRPGEWRRVYGTTSVFVDARDGQVLLAEDARDGNVTTRAFESLQPLHTGEAGGWVFRSLVAIEGLWLLAMIVLGVGLWWQRRRVAQRARVV